MHRQIPVFHFFNAPCLYKIWHFSAYTDCGGVGLSLLLVLILPSWVSAQLLQFQLL